MTINLLKKLLLVSLVISVCSHSDNVKYNCPKPPKHISKNETYEDGWKLALAPYKKYNSVELDSFHTLKRSINFSS